MNNIFIYTSYFSNYRNFPKEAIPIAITLYPPKGYNGLVFKDLAPIKDILLEYKEDADKNKYVTKYKRDVLNKTNQHIVVNQLLKLSNIQPIILLCYEKPEDFCHRHIVADWLQEEGYKVKEISNEKRK